MSDEPTLWRDDEGGLWIEDPPGYLRRYQRGTTSVAIERDRVEAALGPLTHVDPRPHINSLLYWLNDRMDTEKPCLD